MYVCMYMYLGGGSYSGKDEEKENAIESFQSGLISATVAAITENPDLHARHTYA